MPAPITRRITTAIMTNLRREFFSGASSGVASLFCVSSDKLLSSEIIFVVCLRHAESTGQSKLGNVVLVECADVLIVCLLSLRLRLRDRQIVRDARAESLLRITESFIGEFHIRMGCLYKFGCGLDIEQAVAHVLVDLLHLIGELRRCLFILRAGYLLLPSCLGNLQERRADLTGRREGPVRM